MNYKAGDPDPTPESLEFACMAESSSGWDTWQCFRDSGHDGDHVCGNGDIVVHVWPQALAPIPALSEPRTVTTVEELDALPVGSVVMASCDGDVIVARKPHPMEYPFAVAHYWDAVGTELGTDAWSLLYDRVATVLYSPTPPK